MRRDVIIVIITSGAHNLALTGCLGCCHCVPSEAPATASCSGSMLCPGGPSLLPEMAEAGRGGRDHLLQPLPSPGREAYLREGTDWPLAIQLAKGE